MTDYFVANDTIRALYNLDPGETFEEQFSSVSVESILFYVVASAIWTLEKLFDRHRQETTDIIDTLKPHSLRWYVNKAKVFQFGKSLIPDTDTYDNTGMTAEQIEAQQVVKYAAAVEKAAVVYIKVAGGSADARSQLTAEQEDALVAYFKEVKDAGVKLEVVNREADKYNVDIDVYYDPQVFDSELNRLDGTGKAVHDAVAEFVASLPFNGEYRNSALVNMLTGLDGVVMVELKRATADGQPINAKYVPEAGYFAVDKDSLGINAIAYETVSD